MKLHPRHERVRKAETLLVTNLRDWKHAFGLTDAEVYMLVTKWLYEEMGSFVRGEREDKDGEEK